MLAIRLRRVGSKKRPYFRIVVIEASNPRDGSFVEILGHYSPKNKPALVDVDRDRLQYWLERGARPSDTVRTLVARHLTAPVAVSTAAGAPRTPAAESPASS